MSNYFSYSGDELEPQRRRNIIGIAAWNCMSYCAKHDCSTVVEPDAVPHYSSLESSPNLLEPGTASDCSELSGCNSL